MDDESSNPSAGATITPDDIWLDETCGACPEQYDAYVGMDEDKRYVGYLRLRHGTFRVDDASGKTILTCHPKGDGIFDPEERDYFLSLAKMAICVKLKADSWNLQGDLDRSEEALGTLDRIRKIVDSL